MVASAFSARPCGVRACCPKGIKSTTHLERASVKARVASVKDDVENSVASAVVEEEEPVFEDAYEIATLSVDQVNDLIKTVSEETSIAEVHLKLANLEVKFRRSSGNVPAAAAAPPPPPPVQPAPVPVAPAPVAVSLESIDDYDMSESTISVNSPKVGFMCVHKYVKGNRVGRDPIVKVGDKVKKGQTIAYIGQLGTHWPVEAPMSGEIIEIVVKDGEVVEYDQEIARIVPFFGGHIIGDSKLK